MPLRLITSPDSQRALQLASSQGRSYGDSKWSWTSQGTATLSWLLTGVGLHGNCDSDITLAVALGALAAPGVPHAHAVSDVILGIAEDVNSRTFTARERIGIGPEEAALAAETNLSLDTSKANVDAYVWMGLGNVRSPHTRAVPAAVIGLFTFACVHVFAVRASAGATDDRSYRPRPGAVSAREQRDHLQLVGAVCQHECGGDCRLRREGR